MRILHLIDTVGMYGAERMLLDLMSGQREAGWSPVLASVGGDVRGTRPIELAARDRGIRVEKFPLSRGINLLAGQRIWRFAKASRFDLLHSHSYKPNIILGLQPVSVRRLPLMMTLHGWRLPSNPVARFVQSLEAHAIQRADAVVAVHEALAKDARLTKLRRHQLQVVHNGLPNRVSEPPCPTEARLAEELQHFLRGKFAIMSVGRLSAEKGFEVLLAAVAKLRKEGTNAALVVFGEGDRRRRLDRTAAKLGITDSLKMPGFVKQIRPFQSMFDVFAMPSYAEGLPLALLEAMSERIPVVASAVSSLPDILQRGAAGRLFDTGDENSLANELFWVRNSPRAVMRMVNHAERVVHDAYPLKAMVRNYQRISQEVAGIKGNRSTNLKARTLSTTSS